MMMNEGSSWGSHRGKGVAPWLRTDSDRFRQFQRGSQARVRAISHADLRGRVLRPVSHAPWVSVPNDR